MKKFLEDLDQKLFNVAVDFGHAMINKGYAKAWFNWIAWIGLVALIFVAAKRASSCFLYAVGVLSAVLLFFVGLAGVEKLRDDLLPQIKGGGIVVMLIVALSSILGLWVVMNVLFELLPASVAA